MVPFRTRPAIALLGLLAIVLGTVGVHRHVSVETHATCEHGAEVHVERVGEAVAVPEPSQGPVLADPVWWESEGDHHHCGAVAPIVCAEPECVTAPTVLPGGFTSQPVPVSRVAIATALFRLAPKTSPPRALV
jgi:hypothetical protein